jgi:autotransporter-associated beta strand protein
MIISPSGVVLKDGKPYRSIGGNVPFDTYELFEHNNTAYLQTFADMKASGMDFVRLTALGWGSSEKLVTLYFTDKAAYFQKMDQIVDAAAQNGVGISFGITWWINCMSNYFGEPMLASSVPGTKTYEGMRSLAIDFATHYKNNPAVLCYSDTVELNLSADQPNSGQSVNDRWTIEAIQTVLANISGAIRSVDPSRAIHSGSGNARGDQWHMTNYCVWNPDTPAQYARALADSNPDPANTLDTHYYPAGSTEGCAWDVYNTLSRQLRKPIYAEEWGEGGGSTNVGAAANFNLSLSHLIDNRVPLMSVWYSGAPQVAGGEDVSPRGTWAYMWNAIAQANAQYKFGPWKSPAVTSGAWSTAGSWTSGTIPTTADDVYLLTDATTSRTLSISGTAYARNLAIGTGATSNLTATIDINGAGQLVLGQNSALTFATTTDGTTPTTFTSNSAHGQLLDSSGRNAILSINQSTGETKPAIVANTVSAYQMKTGVRANLSAETTQLNLFDGMAVGGVSPSAPTVYQTGGIVRVGLDATVAGGAPAGLVFSAGSSTPKYVLSGGTLAASGITGTTGAVLDWQGGTISSIDGASMIIAPALDMQLNTTATHTINVADANQSITVNASAKISGSGNLTKSGPGNLVLLGTSLNYPYSGTTTINDGILQVKTRQVLPGWNSSGRVFVGARLASTLNGVVTAGTVALNVGGSGEWRTSDIGTILGGSGKITFGDGSALGIDTSNATGGTVTLTNQITGNKGITKLGTGTLVLNPSASNTFTGMTTVMGGTLQLGTTNTVIPQASGFDVQGGTLDLGGTNITLSGGFSGLTDNPSNPPLPWLTQPSRVTFAGGVVQNGTITNNTSATAVDPMFDGQSGTVSANLAGDSWLWKTTQGTLTLTGNNSYTRGTRISKGTLIVGHANALGTTGDIVFMNGTLKYATGITTDYSARFKSSYSAINIDTNGQTITFASPISSTNASGLKKSGAGTLILSSTNNAYTGGTWVDQGTLQTSVDGVLPATNNLTVCNGATLDLNGTTQAIDNLYSMGGGAVAIVNNKSGTQATLTISGSNTGQFGGILADHASGTGTVALAKAGSGRLTLAGVNTYTGPTTISAGSLELASPSGPAMNGNLTIAYGAWLLLSANNQFGSYCTLDLNGEMVLQNSAQTLTTLTGGGIIENDHRYSPLGVVASGTATLTVNNSSADTFNGVIRDNALGNGKMALTKTGNGTLTFTGASTYTGSTNINAGTFRLTGSLHAGSAVSINASAVLTGSGTVNGPLTVNSGGIVAPGVGAGTLTAGATTLSGTYACEIDGTTADRLTCTGNLTLNPGAMLAISTLNAPTLSSYVIASYSGTLTGSFANVTGKPVGFDFVYDDVLKQIRLELINTWTGSVDSNWNTSTANWTAPTVWNNGAVAVFGAGNWTLNVLGNITADNITGLDGSDTIQIGAGNSLQISNANISASPWVNITGTGALSIGGEATVTLGTANTFNGTLTSTRGTVSFDSLGSAVALVMSGGNFTYAGGGATVASLAVIQSGTLSAPSGLLSVGTLTGSGTLALRGSGWQSGLILSGTANNGFSGTIEVGTNLYYGMLYLANENLLGTNANALTAGGGTWLYDNGSPLTIANHKITVPGSLMFVANSSTGDMIITGGITGAGGVTFHSYPSRAIVIGGSNDYAGTTYISDGNSTLRLGANNALPSGTGKGNLVFSVWGPSASTLDLAGFNQTLNGFSDWGNGSGDKVIDNVSAGGTVALTVGAANADSAFAGSIKNTTGTVNLGKIGTGTLTLSGTNTYTGNTTVSAGTLILADNAQLKFFTGATSGVNNAITGTGTVVLNGDFVIDTSATDASVLASGSWRIENLASRTYANTFTVVGWTDAGSNKWTKTVGTKDYAFDETTGVVTLSSSFNSWIATHGLTGAAAAFDADPDHDGIANGLELVLGGEPNPANPNSNSSGLLPTATGSSGDLIFSFKRKVVSESGVVLTFQWSTGVNFPSQENDIVVGASSSVINGVNVTIAQGVPDSLTDTVVITVPAVKAVGAKLFGRLKAVQVQ